jgi:hypothetical protein
MPPLLRLLLQTQPLMLRLLVQSRQMFGGEDPISGNPWHHAKITWHAARDAGWDATGQIVSIDQVSWADKNGPYPDNSAAAAVAWHADYVDSYLYNPLWWASGGWGRFKAALLDQADLVNLHFDDTTSTRQIQLLWDRYLGGIVAGLLWAAERNDVGAARNVVGAGLHALQDFYSHSNWVDDPNRRGTIWPKAGPQAGATSDPRDAMHLYTGAYEHATQTAFKPHGKYAFDCALMRRLIPAELMDLACAAISPLSNTALCRRWQECKGAVSPRPETVAGVPIPPNIFYVEPPGIALDNKWMSKIAVQQRDLPDRGQTTATGDAMFTHAQSLAQEHTTAWLKDLDTVLGRAGYGAFWQRVKTEPRTGDRQIPGPPELANMLGRYNGDIEQYEDAQRMPFTFVSAGKYPPDPGGTDEGWFLRLDISTASETNAGTDADIYADIYGKSFLLDHMHERTPQGGIGQNRLLEYNDFEAGSTDTYVVGPLVQRPRELVLRNSAASALDVVEAAWKDLKDVVSGIVEDLGDFLLSLIGGHADYVGADKRTWSWADLNRIRQTGPESFTLQFRSPEEGKYDVRGTLSSTEDTPTGVRARVTLHTLYCVAESKWDEATWEDEPFVVAFVSSPASDQRVGRLTSPFSNVNTGETRSISPPLEWVMDVPRNGGLILASQVWESDVESKEERDKIRDNFARRFDEGTVNERSAFLDALGRAIAPDWKAGMLDAYAFKRGKVVEVAHLATNRPLNRWVGAGESLAVPLDTVPTRAVSIDASIEPAPPLPAPTLVSPAEGQKFSRDPSKYTTTMTLTWQAVTGAAGYRVEVQWGSRYTTGNTTAIHWEPLLSTDVIQTSFTFEFYYSLPGRWRVVALDASGARRPSQPSVWRTFDYTI